MKIISGSNWQNKLIAWRHNIKLCLGLIMLMQACVPGGHSQSGNSSSSSKPALVTEDHIYNKNVRTVMLFPHTGQIHDMIQPPVISLKKSTPLILHFDELTDDAQNYAVKIINCDANWEVSDLPEMQYLSDYNEYLITERKFSFNTRIPFVHYSFKVPKVKVSGNYLLVVYDEDNPDDLVLTRRFIVFEDQLSIAPKVQFSNVTKKRDSHQQVDFKINYSGLELINPTDEIKVVIRQNHRWDNMITGLKPLYVREFEKSLDYSFFSGENNFPGGNEFRMFDIRSTQYAQQHIDKIDLKTTPIEVSLLRDQSRAKRAYGQYEDADGKFYTQHHETQGTKIEPDYVYVNFALNYPYPREGNVYVVGGMNDWQPKEEFKLVYDEDKKQYRGKALLKQGFYNYMYTLIEEGQRDDTFFEGSHSLTQNHYEVLVYYRPMGFRSDQLIGYKNINFNEL
ncbi:DUF5103 domain-containing protein [Cytophagaceae bacterium ABcell3]|nr:DUF5103 domain-containing protein [Cytophagaceae bacterium ABcell3]